MHICVCKENVDNCDQPLTLLDYFHSYGYFYKA